MNNPIVQRLTALAGTTNSHQFAIKPSEAAELAKIPGCPIAIVDRVAKCNRPNPPQHVLIRRHELEALSEADDANNATPVEGGDEGVPNPADA